METSSFREFRVAVEDGEEELSFETGLGELEENSAEESIKNKCFYRKGLNEPGWSSSDLTTSLSYSEQYSPQETTSNSLVISSKHLEHSGEQQSEDSTNPSENLRNPKLGSWNSPFLSENLISLNAFGRELDVETADLFGFDNELAQPSFFATHIQEDMGTCGVSGGGMHLGLPIEVGVKMQNYETETLQTLPRKIVWGLEALEELVNAERQDNGTLMSMLHDEFGEAGEYMDIWDIGEYI